MSVKTYSFKKHGNDKVSEHFRVREFRCRDDSDKILIESELVEHLEKVRDHFDCSSVYITSGYRTRSHDKTVGGSGSGSHTKGKAVDFIAYDKNGDRVSSKDIALYLEDLGVKGIGYCCGGSLTATHMDINYRTNKWYGDESKSMAVSCCKSFYDYFGVKYSTKKTKAAVNVRKEPTLTGEKLKILPKGSIISMANTDTIERDGYTWARIKINGRHYWIAKKYLK